MNRWCYGEGDLCLNSSPITKGTSTEMSFTNFALKISIYSGKSESNDNDLGKNQF